MIYNRIMYKQLEKLSMFSLVNRPFCYELYDCYLVPADGHSLLVCAHIQEQSHKHTDEGTNLWYDWFLLKNRHIASKLYM